MMDLEEEEQLFFQGMENFSAEPMELGPGASKRPRVQTPAQSASKGKGKDKGKGKGKQPSSKGGGFTPPATLQQHGTTQVVSRPLLPPRRGDCGPGMDGGPHPQQQKLEVDVNLRTVSTEDMLGQVTCVCVCPRNLESHNPVESEGSQSTRRLGLLEVRPA